MKELNIRRRFAIGETIWDATRCQWGNVVLLKHTSAYKEDMLANTDKVTYTHDGKAYDLDALFCYQTAKGYTFQGEKLCWEHGATQDDYPFYCPKREKNVFFFETDKK